MKPLVPLLFFFTLFGLNQNKAIAQSYMDSIPKKTALYFADKMPEFPGGRIAMETFIRKNLQYPTEAKENIIQGKVFVKFIVNSDGSISDILSLRRMGYGLDEEAIRLVRSMPNWIPGKQNGIAVNVYMTIPIKFVLN
ncbi:MAG: energy transducer TonB [Bacteroidia bacterium]|nr:energy transducer TonB [Bacteroidia bacterium]MCF8427716.1 energy transducer TonB [Bacteroidia bacterium]